MSWVDLLDIQTSVEKNVVSSCFHSYLWLMKHTCALSLLFLGRQSWRSTPTFSSFKSQINLIHIELNQIPWWEPIPNLPFRSHKSTFRSHRLKINTISQRSKPPCFFHSSSWSESAQPIWYHLNPPGVTTTPWRFAVFLCFFFLGDPRFRAWLVPGRKAIHDFWSFNGIFFPSWNNWPIVNTSNGPSNLTSTSIQTYPFLKNTDVWYILVTTKNLSWSNLAPVTDTFCDFTIPKNIALE